MRQRRSWCTRGFRSYLTSSEQFGSPIPPAVPQWVALFLVPPVVFGVGVAWVNGSAQLRQDAQIGRAIRAPAIGPGARRRRATIDG